MEVKIGVQNAQRELVLDTQDSAEEVESRLAEALTAGGIFAVHDSKGRRVAVPADKVAYVEFGGSNVGTVGFR